MTQPAPRAPLPARRDGRRRILAVLAVVVAFLASSALPSVLTPAASGQSTATYRGDLSAGGATTRSTGWPANTDPSYFPLRDPVEVDCSYRNCQGGTYHPYWAVDLTGNQRDPVYAAGSGVVHIGDRTYRCVQRGSTRYTPWLWVDHGGGVITKYRHITNISVSNGQRVTPNTRLGTLSHGGAEPCDNFYLHFEVRLNSINGSNQINPGQLRACVNNEQVTFPRAIAPGYESWRGLPTAPGSRKTASSEGVECWGAPSPPPARPSIATLHRGASSATVTWRRAPVPVNRVVVALIRPLTGSAPTYRRLDDDVTRTTFSGLRSGGTYLFRLAFHNTTGWSSWSVTRS